MTGRRDEQWLRDRLAGAVPQAPADPGRASGARDRHRRAVRRTTVLAATAAAVAVLAVALPVAWSHSAGGRVSPTDVPAPGACPPPGNWWNAVHPSGPGTLAPGATWIQLCPGPSSLPDLEHTLPEGVLNGDAVVRLVTEVNAQPAADPICSDTADVAYWLTFGYPDGTTRRVLGEGDYCARLYVGGARRGGGDRVLSDFLVALTAERAAQSPPAAPPRLPSCEVGPAAPFLADPKATTQAALCVQYSTNDTRSPGAYTSGLAVAVPIPAADLRTLLGDWTARQDGPHQPLRTTDCPGAPPADTDSYQLNWTLNGVTAWGDATQLQTGPFGVWMGFSGTPGGFAGDSGQAGWFAGCPSAASEQILDRLIAQVPKPSTLGAR